MESSLLKSLLCQGILHITDVISVSRLSSSAHTMSSSRLFAFLGWGQFSSDNMSAGHRICKYCWTASSIWTLLLHHGMFCIHHIWEVNLCFANICLCKTCDCSEKDINVGPTAIMALMTAKISHYGPEYAVLLTFFTGIVILVAGFLRLGFLIDFFSLPVIAGFTSAAAITIASSQVGSFDHI